MLANLRGSLRKCLTLALQLLAGVAVAYIGGYLMMGSYGVSYGKNVRFYPSQWQADFFAPAAKAESIWIGRPMQTACLECERPAAVSR